MAFQKTKKYWKWTKNLIWNDDNEMYTPRSEFDDEDKKQQTNNIDTKPANVFNYLKV